MALPTQTEAGPVLRDPVAMQKWMADVAAAIAAAGGGGGDSLWTYTTGVLEPDPATTTPISQFGVEVDDGAGNRAMLIMNPAVDLRSTEDITIRADEDGSGGYNMILSNNDGAGNGGTIQLDGKNVDLRSQENHIFLRSFNGGRTRIQTGVTDTIELIVGTASPNGSITGIKGSLFFDKTAPALYQNTNGATAWTIIGGGGGSSPLTTLGDLWGFSTTDDRLPVGADRLVLRADSTQPLGVQWDSIFSLYAATGTISPTTVGYAFKFDTSAGVGVLNLPTGFGSDWLSVTNDSGSGHNVTVNAHAGQTVQGGASITLTDHQSCILVNDSTNNWMIVAEKTDAIPIADTTGVSIDTTTYTNPVTGSGKIRTVVFPTDTTGMAFAVSGDAYPRLVITSSGKLYLSDGTFDAVAAGGPRITSSSGADPQLNFEPGALVVAGGNVSFGVEGTNVPRFNTTSKPLGLGGGLKIQSNTGTPASHSTPGDVGDIYIRTNGGVGTTLYRCTTAGAAGAATWTAIL